ncbi:hypothetical protein Nepgr_020046 [Nepenthes gracilis]|uniref:Uncharacterized protein n=1 Tax=Nepenthes gracilis TaxID=150966 RepID=A0AAD3SW58_NEPGR|nr:hypothetical protein Nepgr_020046 [Nepenthes gracilis]
MIEENEDAEGLASMLQRLLGQLFEEGDGQVPWTSNKGTPLPMGENPHDRGIPYHVQGVLGKRHNGGQLSKGESFRNPEVC